MHAATVRFDLTREPPAETLTPCACRGCPSPAGERLSTAAHVEVMGADALPLGAPVCDDCARDLDADAATAATEKAFLATLQEVSRETFARWGRTASFTGTWAAQVNALTYPRERQGCGFVAFGASR